MRGLRTGALVAITVGGVGSLSLMLRAGRDSPRLLLVMMGCWVVSPFASLAIADAIASRWPPLTRTTLHVAALALTPATLAVYGAIASTPTRTQTPFFVLVPPASWLLMAIAVATAALFSPKR